MHGEVQHPWVLVWNLFLGYISKFVFLFALEERNDQTGWLMLVI